MMRHVLPPVEKYVDVAKWLYEHQLAHGDSVKSNFLPVLQPLHEDIYFFQSVPEEVLTVLNEWSTGKKNRFEKKYGKIGELAGRWVDESFLNALVNFWDPVFHCFTFDGKDICPTLEEISRILEIEICLPCYSYVDDTYRSLEDITGIRSDYFIKYVSEYGLETRCLLKLLKEPMKEEYKFGIMALAIYGTIIFPQTIDYIRTGVIPLVRALQKVKNPVNPIMAILAEIIRSLDECRDRKGGSFSASAHILYIWARSHFPGKFARKCKSHQPDVIDRFYQSDWGASLSKEKWIVYFLEKGRQSVQWLAPWMTPVDRFLYRCGNFPWVPLLGVYGGTGYAPWSFRRQVAALHCVPATNGLCEVDFDYCDVKTSMILIPQIKKAWERTRWVGKDNIGISSFGMIKYDAWRANRGHGFIPPPFPNSELWSDEDIEESEEEMELKTLREEVKMLEQIRKDRDQLKEENDRLQHALETSQREIEKMKDESRIQENRKRKFDHENIERLRREYHMRSSLQQQCMSSGFGKRNRMGESQKDADSQKV